MNLIKKYCKLSSKYALAAILFFACSEAKALEVSGPHLTPESVTTDRMGDGAVTTPKIDDSAVTSTKIDDSAVTTDKIRADAVTSSKIFDGAVTTSKLANDALLDTTRPGAFSALGVGTASLGPTLHVAGHGLFKVAEASITVIGEGETNAEIILHSLASAGERWKLASNTVGALNLATDDASRAIFRGDGGSEFYGPMSVAGSSLTVRGSLLSGMAVFEDTGANSNPNIQIKNDAQAWQLQTIGSRGDRFEIFDITAGGAAENAFLYIEPAGGAGFTVPLTIAGSSLTVRGSDISSMAIFEDIGANSTPNIQIKNDAQSWQLQTAGSRGDRFEIFDITAGGAAENAFLYIEPAGGAGFTVPLTIAGSSLTVGTDMLFKQDTTISGNGIVAIKLDADNNGNDDFRLLNSAADITLQHLNAELLTGSPDTRSTMTATGHGQFQAVCSGLGCTASNNGAFKFFSRTTAQLLAMTPAVGEAFYDSDLAKVVVATGTSAGNFATIDGSDW